MRAPPALACLIALVAAQSGPAQDVAVPAPIAPQAAAAPRWVRGTEVQLMVTKEVNSRSAKPGDRFKLRVNAPVLIDGATVIPIGATAWAEVISVSGTSAAGGRGQLSMRLLHVDTPSGQVMLTGTKGTEGEGNTGGVILGVLGFGLLGLLNKGGNAMFKAGDIIAGYIAEGDAPVSAPLVISQ